MKEVVQRSNKEGREEKSLRAHWERGLSEFSAQLDVGGMEGWEAGRRFERVGCVSSSLSTNKTTP